MSSPTRASGQFWEDFAARHMLAAGLQILTRQYLCRLGEIDIIALEGDTLVFVEVRHRTRSRFADAAASVTPKKQQRIIKAARHFLMRHREYGEYPMRMDVIAIQTNAPADSTEPVVRWIRAAFDAQ